MLSGRHRITARLSPVFVVLCLVLIGGIWLATLQRINSERRQTVSAAMDANSNLAIAFQQQVHRTLKAAEQLATFVREQYISTQGNTTLSQWAQQGFIRETMFNIISVVNEHGDVVDTTDHGVGVNYADREFFTTLRDNGHDGLFISPPVLGRVSNVSRVPMALRISRADGSFAGVVVMSVGPDDFTDFYRLADLGGHAMLELIGMDGVVRSRRAGVATNPDMGAGKLIDLSRLRDGPAGGYIHDGADLDGVTRIVAYRRLDGYPLLVAVGTAAEDELALFNQRRHHYLLQAVAASVIILFFAGWLGFLLNRRRKESRALQESESLYRATFNQAGTGMAHVTTDGLILRANRKLHDMLAYQEPELAGVNLFAQAESSRVLASGEIEKAYRRKDGAILWVSETAGTVKAARGETAYLVIVMQDITARKALEAKLSHDALHDVLTGLPNRNMFHDRLSVALASAHRRGHMTAVLYLDLDGFKQINDSYGHATGDILLQQVAKRLRANTRAEDTVSRFGGDEFAIVLSIVNGEQDCQKVADKLVQALSQPYVMDDVIVTISASVGCAVYPVHGHDKRSLILSADAAMYTIKGSKRRTVSTTPDHEYQ